MKLLELDNQKTPNSSNSVESVTLFLVNMPRLFRSPCFSPACVSALSRSRAPPLSPSLPLGARSEVLPLFATHANPQLKCPIIHVAIPYLHVIEVSPYLEGKCRKWIFLWYLFQASLAIEMYLNLFARSGKRAPVEPPPLPLIKWIEGNIHFPKPNMSSTSLYLLGTRYNLLLACY